MRIVLSFALAALVIFPVHASLHPSSVKKESNQTELAFRKAIQDFNQLSRSERKERNQEIRSTVRNIRKAIQNREDIDTGLALLVILAVILPPLAVYLKENEINSRFWISLLLSLLFWLPGVIYSLLVVLNKD